MQGSVHEFDEDSAIGSVLLDDGRRVRFSAQAFADSGLRRLRIGQRLTVEITGPPDHPQVTRLGIVGL